MRKWLALSAGLISLMAAPQSAWCAPQPFDKVVPAAPVYAAVRQLESSGFFTGHPGGTFDGKRSLTRYDFAVATERIYRSLVPRVAAAEKAGQLSREVESLQQLLDQFEVDIAALGHDVEEMREQLRSMSERVARLQENRAPDTGEVFAAALARPRAYGVRSALRKPLVAQTISNTPLTRSIAALPSPTLDAEVGSAQISLGVKGPDRLHSEASLPFEDSEDAINYFAQLSLPFGSYTLSAFYSRAAGMWDHYGLSGLEFAPGPVEEVGGSLTRSLSDRLDLQLATATINSLDDDLVRMVYWKGGIHYRLGSGFFLGLGYERTFQLGIAGLALDSAAYTLRIDRSLGSNARLGLLIRQLDPRDGGNGGSDLRNSSAITQINVRF